MDIRKEYLLFWFLTHLAGCARNYPQGMANPPGFFSGLFHGVIIPISLILSMFTEYKVYAIPNSGFYYKLGFMTGIMILISIIKSLKKKGPAGTPPPGQKSGKI